MKSILEQDHYTLLEVPRFAPRSEIVKAYHRMKAAFDPDSVATYSLFSSEETAAISARVDDAFRVLIDDRKKEIYDRWLQARERGEEAPAPEFSADAASEQLAAAAIASSGTSEVKPFVPRRAPLGAPSITARTATDSAAPGGSTGGGAPLLRPVPPGGFRGESETDGRSLANDGGSAAAPPAKAPPPQAPPVDEEAIRKLLAPERERDGSFYRLLREARGLTLAQVTEKTKINVMYMRFIEENNFRDLPAAVYLRGFLVQMGRMYRLESPDREADAYMAIAERRKQED